MLSSYIVVIKPCSHVICKTCTDGFVMPSSQCVACDGPAKPKDIIELMREGQFNRRFMTDMSLTVS